MNRFVIFFLIMPLFIATPFAYGQSIFPQESQHYLQLNHLKNDRQAIFVPGQFVVVLTQDGSTFKGNIADINPKSITLGEQAIPLEQIKLLRRKVSAGKIILMALGVPIAIYGGLIFGASFIFADAAWPYFLGLGMVAAGSAPFWVNTHRFPLRKYRLSVVKAATSSLVPVRQSE